MTSNAAARTYAAIGKSVSGGCIGLPAHPRTPLNVRPRIVRVGRTENFLIASTPVRSIVRVGGRGAPCGPDTHAAVAGLGLETCRELTGSPDAIEQPGEEVEVHAAYQLALLLGEAMERAVRQSDLLPAREHRLVALLREDVHDRSPTFVATACRRRRFLRRAAELATRGVRGFAHAVADRPAASGGLGHGGGEHRSGEVVVAFGDRGGQLVARDAVQLGGTSGARSDAASRAFVPHVGDSCLDELVEVERGD